MHLVWTGIELLASCIDISFCLLIPTFQLGALRKGIRRWHIAAYIIFSTVILTAYNYFTNNSISSMYFMIITIIIYVSFFCVGKWIPKVFWMLFPTSSIFFMDRVVNDMLVDVTGK